MSVKISYLGILKKYQPAHDEKGAFETQAGIPVGQVLSQTEIVNCGMGYVILVNGIRKSKDYVLQDGDKVSVMPMVAGG